MGDEQRPILLLGQPGCGKTHLAIGAVEAGYRGYFTTADAMTKTLLRADHDGTAPTKIKAYTAPAVLVIDDVGLIPLRTGAEAAWFFEVVNTRYNKGHPTIVTTNRGLPQVTGATSSATPSSPPPSWTGSCTTPSCSTSAAQLAPTPTQRTRNRRHRTHPQQDPLTSPAPTRSARGDASFG